MIVIPKDFTMEERGAVWRLAGQGFQVTLERGNKPDVARFVMIRGVQKFIADIQASRIRPMILCPQLRSQSHV